MTRYVIGRNIILAVLLGIVVYLTLIPLVMILYGTFRDGPPGTAASFTLANYVRAYGDLTILKLAWNTMVFAIGAAIVAFVFGGFLAWVTERTDTPLKGVIYGLALFPFVIPGILTTIAWVLLLSPRIGWVNRFFIDQLGLSSAPFDLYSLAGMIWVFGIDNITLPFFLMAAAFRSMDPALEEAGRASGMSGFSTFWHVNLKLTLPTAFAVLLLLVVRGIETFEVPAVIGLPAEIKVYASEIFLALRLYQPPDYNLAGAYSTFYLVVASAGVALYLKATSASESYATITGKGIELDMELTVEKGLGYVPVELRKTEKLPIGVIDLDAIFSPVVGVNFVTENMRVGDRTDYNRTRVTIETDGSITQSQALKEASTILESLFGKVSQIEVRASAPTERQEVKQGENEEKKQKPPRAKKASTKKKAQE